MKNKSKMITQDVRLSTEAMMTPDSPNSVNKINRKSGTNSEQFINGSIDKPISKAHKAYDTDLARDNLENDIPAADLQDL